MWGSEIYNKNDIDVIILADRGIFGIGADYETIIFKQPNINTTTKKERVYEYYDALYRTVILVPAAYILSQSHTNEANEYREKANTYFFKTQEYYDLLNKEKQAQSNAQFWMTSSIVVLVLGILEMANYSDIVQTIPSYSPSPKESGELFYDYSINLAQINDTSFLLLNLNF